MNDAIEHDDGLSIDVACALLECQVDRPQIFANGVSRQVLNEFAELLATRLAPRIGGRYQTKVPSREARNLAVVEMFNGRNHVEVQRHFNISRRLFYSILARYRTKAKQA